ncbi:hypothetical protein CN220_11845 [Sinorhizobium meliloti]|nr:hypothetical protein CN220_11845 [Sinorhizobium meliloti]RVH33044.1 hypothetical protein CN211_18930 [Sinorhizobium meliloti]
MSGRYQRHASVDDLRQNLNPLQITLAYRNQSHPQSPRSSKPGESDILTLQKQDTSTLRLHKRIAGTAVCSWSSGALSSRVPKRRQRS